MMEASLKFEQLDMWSRTFECELCREETRDCVVPDTMPDIAQVLSTGGNLLIRSKDVSAGRVKLELSLPVKVLYRGDDDSIGCVELEIAFDLAADSEKIGQDSICLCSTRLCALETRVLNPRKILVRAELCAELRCLGKASVAYACDIAGTERIHVRRSSREVDIISSVGEKTFALTDEQPLPEGWEKGSIVDSRLECCVDETKTVGSRIIMKGRLKSCLLMLLENRLKKFEYTTEYSQIVEFEFSEEPKVNMWVMPSGVYYYGSADSGESRMCMEFNLVAQYECTASLCTEYLSDAYSNEYGLDVQKTKIDFEKLMGCKTVKSSLRQLYELQGASEINGCICAPGKARVEENSAELPLSIRCIYTDENGRAQSEKYTAGLSFDMGGIKADRLELQSWEISRAQITAVPGGVELSLSGQLELACYCRGSMESISSITYDESSPLDNSLKPSIVLLRAKSGDDLWELARENCSTVEAILEANHMQRDGEEREGLLLIPKSL